MSKYKGTEETKNIDLTEGRFVDGLINNTPDVDAFDQISQILKKVKENDASDDPDVFYGFNFWTMPRTLDYMNKYYGEDSQFYKEVLRTNSSDAKVPKNSTVYECKVHIPEITGILPYPSITKIIGATSAKNLEALPDAVIKSYNKSRPERLAVGFTEILKLAMYPSFFYYSDKVGAPPFGHYCKVKFSKAFPTKGVGIYLGSLKSRFS
tara:strand:+ start:2894 stop:3520 length:627 start_codon:yes stop_codon:yes gene_type:complete